MARKRLINTEELYFKAELVKLLGSRGLHLYIRLWGISEDWGGYEPKYADIALKMGALRFTAKEVEKFIGLLLENRKVVEYEIGGRKVHWIVNFMEHQPLDNPAMPKLPLPEWINCQECKYKSGKSYAKYSIIREKLPVGYHSATGNGVTNSNSNVTKQNRNETIPQEIYDYYSKTIKTGGKEDSIRSITKLLKTGITKEDLLGRIDAYRKQLNKDNKQDSTYYIQANNFFGKAARYKDFEPIAEKVYKPVDKNCKLCQGTGFVYITNTGKTKVCNCRE